MSSRCGSDERSPPLDGFVPVRLQPRCLAGRFESRPGMTGVGPETARCSRGSSAHASRCASWAASIRSNRSGSRWSGSIGMNTTRSVQALVAGAARAAVPDDLVVGFDDHDVGVGFAVDQVGVPDVELFDGRELLVADMFPVGREDVCHRRMVGPAAVGPRAIARRQVVTVGEMHVATLRRRQRRDPRGFHGAALGVSGPRSSVRCRRPRAARRSRRRAARRASWSRPRDSSPPRSRAAPRAPPPAPCRRRS